MFQEGDRLRHKGKLVLEQWLSQGGFGITFLARDTVMDERCALKLLRHERLQDMDRNRNH